MLFRWLQLWPNGCAGWLETDPQSIPNISRKFLCHLPRSTESTALLGRIQVLEQEISRMRTTCYPHLESLFVCNWWCSVEKENPIKFIDVDMSPRVIAERLLKIVQTSIDEQALELDQLRNFDLSILSLVTCTFDFRHRRFIFVWNAFKLIFRQLHCFVLCNLDTSLTLITFQKFVCLIIPLWFDFLIRFRLTLKRVSSGP